MSAEETKVIYHIDDEETPYLVKIAIPPDRVTLADFKNVLNRPSYKFFFKSLDDDFGVVKEEIVDDSAHLPYYNGRVVSWLVSADGSNQSDGGSQCTDSVSHPSSDPPPMPVLLQQQSSPHQQQRLPPPPPPLSSHHHLAGGAHHHHHGHGMLATAPPSDSLCTDTESIISSRHGGGGRRHKYSSRINGHMPRLYETASIVSSDLETTSFQSETTGRNTALSECSSVSRLQVAGRKRPQRRRKQRLQAMSRTSSYSSITDSTMSLNIITVTLNMDTVNFLGISIVGQSNKGGDGGIYVGSIMKGGAVALDGRIEPGDMILQVNEVNFENMSNDEAVRVLREVVQKPGPIKLVVAKCWDPNPKGYFTIPRTEPVRPIDPGAWVAHTAAVRGDPVARPPSSSTVSSASLASTIPANDRDCLLAAEMETLSVHTPMETVVQAMQRLDSGLEIRDRMWLKITIPNAFIGTDMIDWLLNHLDGFQDRRDARKYASHLLKAGFIRHTVNKITFSEQCYYIFGDLCSAMSNMKVSSSGVGLTGGGGGGGVRGMGCGGAGGDTDSVGPLPNVPNYMPYSGTYNPLEYIPMPFYTASENTIYGYNREESVLSGSGGSSNGSEHMKESNTAHMLNALQQQHQQHHSSASDSDLTSLAGCGGGPIIRDIIGAPLSMMRTTGTATTLSSALGPSIPVPPLPASMSMGGVGCVGGTGNGNGSSSTATSDSQCSSSLGGGSGGSAASGGAGAGNTVGGGGGGGVSQVAPGGNLAAMASAGGGGVGTAGKVLGYQFAQV